MEKLNSFYVDQTINFPMEKHDSVGDEPRIIS